MILILIIMGYISIPWFFRGVSAYIFDNPVDALCDFYVTWPVLVFALLVLHYKYPSRIRWLLLSIYFVFPPLFDLFKAMLATIDMPYSEINWGGILVYFALDLFILTIVVAFIWSLQVTINDKNQAES